MKQLDDLDVLPLFLETLAEVDDRAEALDDVLRGQALRRRLKEPERWSSLSDEDLKKKLTEQKKLLKHPFVQLVYRRSASSTHAASSE